MSAKNSMTKMKAMLLGIPRGYLEERNLEAIITNVKNHLEDDATCFGTKYSDGDEYCEPCEDVDICSSVQARQETLPDKPLIEDEETEETAETTETGRAYEEEECFGVEFDAYRDCENCDGWERCKEASMGTGDDEECKGGRVFHEPASKDKFGFFTSSKMSYVAKLLNEGIYTRQQIVKKIIDRIKRSGKDVPKKPDRDLLNTQDHLNRRGFRVRTDPKTKICRIIEN